VVDRADPVDPWTSHPYRVVTIGHELVGTVTLDLAPVDPDRAIGPWAPGQFTMMWVFGVGEVAISISGDGTRPGGVVQTIRAVGSVTELLAGVEVGSVVGLRGPYGTDWGLGDCAGHDVVVVAGGLGLAPLRPAIRRLVADRAGFGHVDVLVGARSPRELLYVEELYRWGSADGVDVHVSVDHATRGWSGDVGVVTQLFGRIRVDPSDARALVCGPEIMMRFAADGLADRGLDRRRIRVSLERNMQCGVGLCGHCQLGPLLVCRDGPVVTWDRVAPMVRVREL
jgi:NAD(P)H-flavin reductase